MRMNPLNAYHRRLVHNALQEIDGIVTESEDGDARYKRITIRLA
jgi:spoIIIJ-associated protein